MERVAATPDFWNPAQNLGLGKIKTKQGQMIPFIPWDHQLILCAATMRAYAENRWLLHIKSRRVGSSTLFSCIGAQHAAFRPGCRVAVIAHKAPVAAELAQIGIRWHRGLQDQWRIPAAHGRKRSLYIPEIDSSMDFYSVKDDEPLRGNTVNVLIATELSSWAASGAANAWTSALNSVSDEGGFIAAESTPKQFGDELHAVSQEADEPGSRWLKVFVPWTSIAHFRIAPPVGWSPGVVVTDYAARHHLTIEQAYWMQMEGLQKCRNDMTRFRSEYPISEDDCWLSPGESMYDSDAIVDMLRAIDGGTGLLGTSAEYEELEAPQKDKKYAIIVDPAGSFATRDKWGIIVANLTDCSVAATMLAHMGATQASKKVADLHARFNRGRIYVEANAIGESILIQLLSMGLARFIFHRYQPGQRRAVPGWHANAKTKAEGIGYLQTLLGDRSLECKSARVLRQLLNARGDMSSETRDEGGGHFDLHSCMVIFAWAWHYEVGMRRRVATDPKREVEAAWTKVLGLVDGGAERQNTRWGDHR